MRLLLTAFSALPIQSSHVASAARKEKLRGHGDLAGELGIELHLLRWGINFHFDKL